MALVQELHAAFPTLDSALIEALLESTAQTLTNDLLEQLQEISESSEPLQKIFIVRKKNKAEVTLPKSVLQEKPVFFVVSDDTHAIKLDAIEVCLANGTSVSVSGVFTPARFGPVTFTVSVSLDASIKQLTAKQIRKAARAKRFTQQKPAKKDSALQTEAARMGGSKDALGDQLQKKEATRTRVVKVKVPQPPLQLTVSERLMVDSIPYRFACALDELYDTLFWAWDPRSWGEKLEHALVELLLVVDDEMEDVVNGLGRGLQMLSMSGSLTDMLDMVKEDLQSAMEFHDAQSLGRLHQTLYQFLEMSQMYPFPKGLVTAISAFETAKTAVFMGNDPIGDAVLRTREAVDAYALFLHRKQGLPLADAYVLHLQRIRYNLCAVLGDAKEKQDQPPPQQQQTQNQNQQQQQQQQQQQPQTQDHAPTEPALEPAQTQEEAEGDKESVASDELVCRDVSPLWLVRSSNSLKHVLAGFGGNQKMDKFRISNWPVLPVDHLISSHAAHMLCPPSGVPPAVSIAPVVDYYTETLTGSVCMVGSIFNYRLTLENIPKNIKVLEALLDAGLGYVCSSEGAFVALHSDLRAALPLVHKFKHSKLAARVKDVQRMLRNQDMPEGPLSLRVNTDFELALAKLRKHHKHSWVNEELEQTWREMFTNMRLVVFELWYGDNMIAADFGHPIRGGSFYVATRFFDKDFKRFQPGFTLALVESRVLRDVFGFTLWDLGGTDSNPMMAYKATVAHVTNRAVFMQMFRQLQVQKHGWKPVLLKGKVVAKITKHHLMTTG